ncbi:MAG: hypothetical protein D6689_20220 [Deltaproteobacteria bacterium]|nr:MAG: hypothetical protein D6689_20220 [Deltaproteobacteria bacterium]
MRRARFAAWAACAAALAAAGCDGAQGSRGPCATPAGAPLACPDAPGAIETPEDACWKLVDCGVIPLVDEDRGWEFCVRRLERLTDAALDYALACIDAATCDDLLQQNSPGPSFDPRLCELGS